MHRYIGHACLCLLPIDNKIRDNLHVPFIGLCDPSLTVEQLLQELRDTDIKQYVSRNRLQDGLLLLLENNKIYPVEEDKYRLID